MAVLVQTEWADVIVPFLLFPHAFSIHPLFTAVLILPIHISQKKVCRLAGSDQSHVDSVDLAPASPISVTVRNLVFAGDK